MAYENIQTMLDALQSKDTLSKDMAMRLANSIVKTIDEHIQTKSPRPAELENLYSLAASAYEIASAKVDPKYRDDVAFPSNYWSMRSKQISVTPRIFANYRMGGTLVSEDMK